MNMVFPQDYQRISYDSFEEAQQSSGQVHPSVKQVTIKLQSLQPNPDVLQAIALGFNTFSSYLPSSLQHLDLVTDLMKDNGDVWNIEFTSAGLFQDVWAWGVMTAYLVEISHCEVTDPEIRQYDVERLCAQTVQDVQLLTLLDVIGVPTTTQTRLYREVLRTAKDFEEMDANGVDYGTTQLLFGVGGGDRIDDLKRRLKEYEANQIRYYPTEHDDIVEMDKVSNLPFWRDGRRYKDAQCKHSIVIVEGETGCGKSLLAPLFSWIEASDRKRLAFTACGLDPEQAHVLVIVVVPTQAAALNLTAHACKVVAHFPEYWQDVKVHYGVGGDSLKVTEKTNIAYVTPGIALKWACARYSSFMRKADVIIIDEIHQLPLENQLLLYVVVHDLMPRNQFHSMPEPVASQKMNEFYERRFLLMSATLDVWEMKVYLKKQLQAKDRLTIGYVSILYQELQRRTCTLYLLNLDDLELMEDRHFSQMMADEAVKFDAKVDKGTNFIYQFDEEEVEYLPYDDLASEDYEPETDPGEIANREEVDAERQLQLHQRNEHVLRQRRAQEERDAQWVNDVETQQVLGALCISLDEEPNEPEDGYGIPSDIYPLRVRTKEEGSG